MRKIDLTGKQVGWWKVIKEGQTKSKKTYWLCQCDCGTIREVLTDSLLYKKSTNCGCKRKEMLRERMTKHKMMDSPLYKVWQNMKNRCRNPKTPHYKYYGGRGITVCDKWQTFEGFYEDMGATYQEGLTLERIDVNGDYCKENCRWATKIEQANNKRNNKIYTYNGVTDTLKRLCQINNVSYTMVQQRLRKGLGIKDAIELPPQSGKKLSIN